ncbi:major facilitator superfamily transporter [Biscogniauxia marginata]|nr:major facilitator superfamily transporter [Biscogniauxia marginata]
MSDTTTQGGNLSEKPTHSTNELLRPFPDTSSTSVSSGQYADIGGRDEKREIEFKETIQIKDHPRDNIPAWRWKALLLANNLLSLINGYDVSNVANVQAPIYDAFGHIEILPWVALGYSICNVATIPLARRLYQFYDFKVLAFASMVLTIAGTVLAGAAPNLNCVIAGRALMAIGSSVVYQGILSFNTLLAHPHELALVQAAVGGFFAIGLITGPIIGGAFADNEHATWRWAFYFALPLLGIALIIQMTCLPSYRAPSSKPLWTHVKETDWVGCLLHIGTFLLFGSACIFSGGTWAWDSGSTIAIWTVFAVVAVAYVVQQTFCIGTTPERRIFPCLVLKNRTILLAAICSFCGSMAYGVCLYYLPLYYAFAHGRGPLDAAVRILPFICLFIFTILLAGGLLPVVRFYMPFFIIGAVCLLVGGGLFHTITTETSEAAVMGFQAIVGVAVGITGQLTIPIGSAILSDTQDRFDVAAIHNMSQLGGVAFALSIAGTVYQNVGLQFLKSAITFVDFTDHEFRELLSGTSSPILSEASPEVLGLAVQAITEVIVRIFYLLLASGAVCFVAACLMKFEALDFKKPVKSIERLAEESEIHPTV